MFAAAPSADNLSVPTAASGSYSAPAETPAVLSSNVAPNQLSTAPAPAVNSLVPLKNLKLEDLGELHELQPIPPSLSSSSGPAPVVPVVPASLPATSLSVTPQISTDPHSQVGQVSSPDASIHDADRNTTDDDLLDTLKLLEKEDNNVEEEKMQGKPGRPSSEELRILDEGLSRVYDAVMGLTNKLPRQRQPATILKLLVGRFKAAGANTWPWYLKYYKANEEEELKCLPDRDAFDCKWLPFVFSIISN